jgi:hypothetical protein
MTVCAIFTAMTTLQPCKLLVFSNNDKAVVWKWETFVSRKHFLTHAPVPSLPDMLGIGPGFWSIRFPSLTQAWAWLGPRTSRLSSTQCSQEKALVEAKHSTLPTTNFGWISMYSCLGLLGPPWVRLGFANNQGPKPWRIRPCPTQARPKLGLG